MALLTFGGGGGGECAEHNIIRYYYYFSVSPTTTTTTEETRRAHRHRDGSVNLSAAAAAADSLTPCPPLTVSRRRNGDDSPALPLPLQNDSPPPPAVSRAVCVSRVRAKTEKTRAPDGRSNPRIPFFLSLFSNFTFFAKPRRVYGVPPSPPTAPHQTAGMSPRRRSAVCDPRGRDGTIDARHALP